MNVRNAAVQILLSARKPFQAKVIAKRVIRFDLWQSERKPPDDATISARLYSDIKKGDKLAFLKVRPQAFALRDFAEI